jgi:hypothetical protein
MTQNTRRIRVSLNKADGCALLPPDFFFLFDNFESVLSGKSFSKFFGRLSYTREVKIIYPLPIK